HKGDKITLMFPLKSLSTADLVYVYAGCDKTIKMCRDKFNNSINYGGFPFVPSKNPVTQGF
ncbi:MAG: phage BR0599 family protein, partial [Campylobacter sp.]|nr:phage BR0599 family protein [Campylobacter sp.]